MEISAHLHILRMISLLNLLKSLSLIWIFTYFILKPFGVLIEKMIMREMSVFMLIIGKIIEENLLFLLILKKCVRIGILKTSLLHTKMVACWSISVPLVMAGKNKSFILISSKLNRAYMEILVKSLTVHITIQKPIGSIHYQLGSSTFLKLELLILLQTFMFPFLVN